LFRLGEGTLALLLTLLLARAARAISRGASKRLDPQLVLLIGRVAYIGVLIAGGLTVLSIIAAQVVPPLLGAVGLLGLAVGLAFQDVLKNFLAGVFLLLERPFRIGDEIRVGEFSGTVETILLRVTVLKSADGLKVLLPNQEVYTSAIVNTSGYPQRQFSSAARLLGDKPMGDIVDRAAAELKAIAGIATDPAPAVSLVPHPEGGATVEARYWLDYRENDSAAVQREVNAMLLRVARAEGSRAVTESAKPESAR
jgi:small-conductance mechanosensitive channel